MIQSKPRARFRGGKLIGVRASGTSYEGASVSRRMGNKGLIGGGPNTSVSGSLGVLQQRSHHAVRNNPYAAGARDTYVTNLVGNGIKPRWGDPEIQQLWNSWACECDPDGDSFYGLQSLAVAAQFESGEAFVRFRPRRSTDRLSVPLQLQLFESEQLDYSFTQSTPGNNAILMGVEFNAIGQRVAYHLWRNHPSGLDPRFRNERSRVSADDIAHVYRCTRPGQIRGVPQLSTVITRLYEVDEMQDATLMRQKLAQLFGAFVKRKPGADSEEEQPFFGTHVFDGELGEGLNDIEPGGIHYLDDGEEVTFSAPADAGSNYTRWLKTELLAIARGSGITYEQLTGDLSGVNYSSIRAGLLEFRRRVEALQAHMVVQKLCRPVAARWLDMAVISGALSIPDYWSPGVRSKLLAISWISPRWQSIDPLKEVDADIKEVRAGFAPRSEKAAERGWDIENLDEETAASAASADRHGLLYDSDPRNTTSAVGENTKYPSDADDDGAGDDE
ncbi:phage portal protein [Carnimonas bestiolae]|uniref:phage portal protein n=1 Tax=Carnimonas bestiolae TaxID=3402172 RepID=UPI003EDC673F